MKFIERIENLYLKYPLEITKKDERAVFLGVPEKTPPLADHIIFSAMPQDVMQAMVNNYRLSFPKELIELYNYMNGASLFWKVRFACAGKIRLGKSRFSIYGIPLTNDRKHIEPSNISIEDLNRPKETPTSWLKFGSYYRPNDDENRLELFVDTNNGHTYAVEHENPKCTIYKTWDTIDNCLCDIFDLLTKAGDG